MMAKLSIRCLYKRYHLPSRWIIVSPFPPRFLNRDASSSISVAHAVGTELLGKMGVTIVQVLRLSQTVLYLDIYIYTN